MHKFILDILDVRHVQERVKNVCHGMCFELFNHLHLCLRRLLPTISLTSRQLGDFLIFCKNGGSKFGTFTLYTSWNFRMVRQLKGIPWEWGDFAVVSVGQVIYDCERMLMGCQTSKWPWAVGGGRSDLARWCGYLGSFANWKHCNLLFCFYV